MAFMCRHAHHGNQPSVVEASLFLLWPENFKYIDYCLRIYLTSIFHSRRQWPFPPLYTGKGYWIESLNN